MSEHGRSNHSKVKTIAKPTNYRWFVLLLALLGGSLGVNVLITATAERQILIGTTMLIGAILIGVWTLRALWRRRRQTRSSE